MAKARNERSKMNRRKLAIVLSFALLGGLLVLGWRTRPHVETYEVRVVSRPPQAVDASPSSLAPETVAEVADTGSPDRRPYPVPEAVDAYQIWLLLDGLTGPVRGQAVVTFSKSGQKNVCTIKENGTTTRRLGDTAQDAFRAAVVAAYHL